MPCWVKVHIGNGGDLIRGALAQSRSQWGLHDASFVHIGDTIFFSITYQLIHNSMNWMLMQMHTIHRPKKNSFIPYTMDIWNTSLNAPSHPTLYLGTSSSGPPHYHYYLWYTRLRCYTRTNALQGSHILCWSCRLSCNLHCHWSYPDWYSKSSLGNYQSQWQLGPHDFHRWLLKSRGISWGQYLKTRINLY